MPNGMRCYLLNSDMRGMRGIREIGSVDGTLQKCRRYAALEYRNIQTRVGTRAYKNVAAMRLGVGGWKNLLKYNKMGFS